MQGGREGLAGAEGGGIRDTDDTISDNVPFQNEPAPALTGDAP
jgi:hypothetical protein